MHFLLLFFCTQALSVVDLGIVFLTPCTVYVTHKWWRHPFAGQYGFMLPEDQIVPSAEEILPAVKVMTEEILKDWGGDAEAAEEKANENGNGNARFYIGEGGLSIEKDQVLILERDKIVIKHVPYEQRCPSPSAAATGAGVAPDLPRFAPRPSVQHRKQQVSSPPSRVDDIVLAWEPAPYPAAEH